MRGSMRAGKVAPGLWGPWTIVDFSGWSDQMTLDYNFGKPNFPLLTFSVMCSSLHCVLFALAAPLPAARSPRPLSGGDSSHTRPDG